MKQIPICSAAKRGKLRSEAGMTLVEAVIALGILFVMTAGLMGVGVAAILTTENQGHLAARVTEYAQDKLEQLSSLAYADGDSVAVGNASDTASASCVLYLTTQTCYTGGSGLKVTATGVNSLTTRTNYYVDYLSEKGDPLGGGTTPPAGWFYERRWMITYPNAADTNVKQITVWATTKMIYGRNSTGVQPTTIVATYKTNPF